MVKEYRGEKVLLELGNVQSELDLRVSVPRNLIPITDCAASCKEKSDLSPLQIEQMILEHVRSHGQIARRDVVQLCGLTASQASYRLAQLTKRGVLVRIGKGATTVYKTP